MQRERTARPWKSRLESSKSQSEVMRRRPEAASVVINASETYAKDNIPLG